MEEKVSKKKKDAMAIRTYLRSLPVCQSSNMAKKLADECKVPLYTFNNWRSGLVKVPELAKDKIEEELKSEQDFILLRNDENFYISTIYY